MEKTPEEIAEEERQAAIARGDVVEDEEDSLEEDEEDSSEEDEEDSSEEDEEEDDEPGDAAPEDDITVPKARFDESRKSARKREAELEARIAELEKGNKKPEQSIDDLEAEIEELEDQHDSLLLEGEIDKAKAVRRELNSKRNGIIDRRISEKSSAMGQAAVEQVRYDTQLASFEVKYPTINPDATEYDEAVSNEVSTLMNAFQTSGMSLVASLNKAVHYVFRGEEPESKSTSEVGDKRKKAARKRALKTVKNTPANLKDIGNNSDKAGSDDGLPDPMKMSQKAFDKLTEKQKAALRGDKLAVAE